MTGRIGQAVFAAVFLGLCLAGFSAAPAAQSAPPDPPLSAGEADSLAKSALIALDNANKTGNYTVLFDLGSSRFQAVNSLARLAAIFADFRRRKIDLNALSGLSPTYLRSPALDKKGLLNLVGHFDAGGFRINFDIVYERAGAGWRLAGLAVGATDAAPVAALPKLKPTIRDSETAPPPATKAEAPPPKEKAAPPGGKAGSAPEPIPPLADETAKLKALIAEKYAAEPRAANAPEGPAAASSPGGAKASLPRQPPLTAPIPRRRPARPGQAASVPPSAGQPLTLSGAPPPLASEPKPGYLRRLLRKLGPAGRGGDGKTPE